VGSRVQRSVSLPASGAPLYTVSQVAVMLDTEGVVSPARSSGRQRRYSHEEIDHVAAVVALMAEGMTLAGAQRIIELENEIASLRGQLEQRAGRA